MTYRRLSLVLHTAFTRSSAHGRQTDGLRGGMADATDLVAGKPPQENEPKLSKTDGDTALTYGAGGADVGWIVPLLVVGSLRPISVKELEPRTTGSKVAGVARRSRSM